MNCHSCGAQLPSGAKVCPNCGTPAPTYRSSSGPSSDPNALSYPYASPAGSAQSYDPTLVAPPSTSSYTPPTAYGSTLYAPPDQQNPYAPPPGSPSPYGPPPPPYIPPQPGLYPPASPPFTPVGPQGQPPPRRFPMGLTILLIVLAILLIIGGGALFYYTAIYQPNRIHEQATATAAVQLTTTAQTQAHLNATATAATENPYTHSGTLALTDSLSDNSKGYKWSEAPMNCRFTGGAYHAIAPDAHFSDYCLASITDFSNFAFEVQMQIIQGDDGGIVFRVENTNPNQYYVFYIGQDGSYFLNMANGSNYPILASGTNTAAINQGLNQTNVIGVLARGNAITLYVNHRQIADVTDGTFSHGQIGFLASPQGSGGHPTEVVFSNARVWTF
jgi:3-keto-disaccharide hydrolase/zinc ribbon protein